MFDTMIKNAKIVSGSGIVEGNLYVQGEQIAAITATNIIHEAKKTIDAKGRYVMPGVVDEHVHILDLEQRDRGDFALDSAGAALAGITTIMEMPLCIPATTTLEAFEQKKKRAAESFKVDYVLYAGAVPGNEKEMEKMLEAGATGFKAMMAGSVPELFRTVNDGELIEAFKVVKKCNSIITLHAENDDLIGNLERQLKAEGRKDMKAFFESRPEYQENEAIARAIRLQKQIGCRVLIVHVSNPEGVDMIYKARCEGQDIHCETGPHYLNLTQEMADKIGPYMKFAPPARSAEAVATLWEKLRQGRIETLGSDHGTGSLKEEKERGWENVWEAANGALGLETSLPLMLSEGVNKGRISMEKLVEVMCENPSKLFGLYPQKGVLQVGADADLLILDMNEEAVVDPQSFQSVGKYSAFDGFKLKGRPVLTMVRGTVAAENGKVLVSAGFGKLVTGKR